MDTCIVSYDKVKNNKTCNDRLYVLMSEKIIKGGLVVFPTETVYGLGASALDEIAVAKIFKAKGRPQDNPLIVHLATPEDAEKFAYTNETYYKLASAFMPGPITVILKKKDVIPDIVTCGMDTVGLRVPSNPIAHTFLEKLAKSGIPVAAPSANISGKPSPTCFEHVLEDMNGKVDMIVDGGKCDCGVESTVVRITGKNCVEILRPGRVTKEDIESAGIDVTVNYAVKNKLKEGEKVASPGMKYRHYAPSCKVILLDGENDDVLEYMKQKQKEPKTGILCYEEDAKSLGKQNLLTFGSKENELSQAHELFDCLRKFDRMDLETVYARLPVTTGVGLAVYNRLIRAAGFTVKQVSENGEG